METFLPNRTIVLLKGGNKRLMIYGRKQLTVGEEEEKMYDYLGVPYPEGYISEDETISKVDNKLEPMLMSEIDEIHK